jgi:excisionase family DNA binding protein
VLSTVLAWVKGLSRDEIPAVLAALAARLLEQPAASNSTTSELIDAASLAARLGVHESFVRTAARAGRIPCVRVGRYVRFDIAAVTAALAEAKL